MNNIIVWDTSTRERFEFLHTPDLGGASSLRIRAYHNRDAHWSLTAEARLSATQSRSEDAQQTKEEPNTMGRPTVPEHVIATAVERAGAGANFKVWP